MEHKIISGLKVPQGVVLSFLPESDKKILEQVLSGNFSGLSAILSSVIDKSLKEQLTIFNRLLRALAHNNICAAHKELKLLSDDLLKKTLLEALIDSCTHANKRISAVACLSCCADSRFYLPLLEKALMDQNALVRLEAKKQIKAIEDESMRQEFNCFADFANALCAFIDYQYVHEAMEQYASDHAYTYELLHTSLVEANNNLTDSQLKTRTVMAVVERSPVYHHEYAEKLQELFAFLPGNTAQ